MSAGARLGYRRVALWGALVSKVVAAWGLAWDIQWHMTIGRDSFWIAPHLMIYVSVVAGLGLGWGVLVYEWLRGVASTRGFQLAAWGLVLVVLAAPIDDLWHRLFGLDVTLWSPPHLLALFGSAVSTLGCLLIAREVYPPGSWAGRGALVLAGALLYGGVRVTLDPSWLFAYTYGGILFHGFAILAALILSLVLVTTARVSALRWAPVFAVILSFAVGVAGQQIARAGFAILEPESFIGEEVGKDASSPIAVSREIAEKNQAGPPPSWPLRLALPLVPAALLALVDSRRRPAAAAIAYALGVFTAYAWFLSTLPAYAPLIPTGLETTAALLITIAYGAAGGLAARWLATRLVGLAPEPRAGRA
ncbi:MAG: hypothetical protein ACREK4_11105, partial [Candidatus Rokuibacteriota bacterium]